MKNFYKENRVFSILMFIALFCLTIIVLFMVIYFFKGQGTNKYGDRLDGIKIVKISDSKLKEIETKLLSEKNISKTKIDIEGKIVYIVFYLKAEGISAEGINASLKALDYYSEEEKKYYDFQFIIEKEAKSETELFPIMGSKNSTSANVVWTKY